MAYEVNKSNGDILVNLIDGEVDNTTTPLNLLGKNYLGYGELIAENFVHMLENFSSQQRHAFFVGNANDFYRLNLKLE